MVNPCFPSCVQLGNVDAIKAIPRNWRTASPNIIGSRENPWNVLCWVVNHGKSNCFLYMCPLSNTGKNESNRVWEIPVVFVFNAISVRTQCKTLGLVVFIRLKNKNRGIIMSWWNMNIFDTFWNHPWTIQAIQEYVDNTKTIWKYLKITKVYGSLILKLMVHIHTQFRTSISGINPGGSPWNHRAPVETYGNFMDFWWLVLTLMDHGNNWCLSETSLQQTGFLFRSESENLALEQTCAVQTWPNRVILNTTLNFK